MMTRSAGSPCISSPLIASYVDGSLRPEERGAVEAHLSSCDDCLELVLEVTRGEEEQEEKEAKRSGTVSPFGHRRAKWTEWTIPLAASLVLAVGSALVYLNSRPTAVATLTSVVGAQRPIEPRLTGGFEFGPLRTSLRGLPTLPDDRLIAQAAALDRRAAETGAPEALHPSAMAQLLLGNAQGAIATLTKLTRSAPDVASYHADLGAAHATLFLSEGTETEATAATQALDRATTLDGTLAEPWFNRALVLEKLGRRGDALQAWTRYLELEREPAWRAEGERRRDALQQSSPSR
jgi:tetratricopeptide (TPR) repeat protein